jgi:AcrR family transcriptional regulator
MSKAQWPFTGTSLKLVEAAAAEFREHGFSGTDTNRIARRAGFAPQTFYRWFDDKIEVFIAVYRLWQAEEKAALQTLLARDASDAELVQAGVQHHRDYLLFRRSLRLLSLENPVVRQARAESRLRQIEQIKMWAGKPDADIGIIGAELFKLERLTDALAEGELADMGLDEAPARAAIAQILAGWRR